MNWSLTDCMLVCSRGPHTVFVNGSMAAASESKDAHAALESKEGDESPLLTKLVAAEPLVLRAEDIADGLSQL